MLAQDRWFSSCAPASSTTKTGRHDTAEILLKVALNTKIQIHTYIYMPTHAHTYTYTSLHFKIVLYFIKSLISLNCCTWHNLVLYSITNKEYMLTCLIMCSDKSFALHI